MIRNAGESITFRNVSGQIETGQYVRTHPMTGEVEVLTSRGHAYVARNAIVTDTVEAPAAYSGTVTGTLPTPTLAERTAALQSILEGLTDGTDISVGTDYVLSTESRVTMHQHGGNWMIATLKSGTTDVALRDNRDRTNQWYDLMHALNTMHAFITTAVQDTSLPSAPTHGTNMGIMEA